MPVVIAVFGVVGFIGGMLLYGTFVGAFVLSVLWGWFVTPLFGIPVPPLPMMAGLSTIVHYVTNHGTTTYEDHKTNWGSNLTIGLLAPWIVLFVGWLIHLWAGG